MQAWRRKGLKKAPERLVVPDFTVTDHSLPVELTKRYKDAYEAHKLETGKAVSTMCQALLPKQSYTHKTLPYVVHAMAPGSYAVVEKSQDEKDDLQMLNSATISIAAMEKDMKKMR